MSKNPLFSTYRAGENRVTSSTLAVLERIDLSLVRELLQNASGMGDELRAVQFENQVAGEGSVPDARISARFTWWFETKTVRHGYDSEGHDRHQVRSHATRLVGDPDGTLFVLTPDVVQPLWFDELDGVDDSVRHQIVWLSFASLAEAVNGVLVDPRRLIGEQTRFLLSELVMLYESDGLLTTDDTVIVAARTAWSEYLDHSAYVCQPGRTFRSGLTHFGFYAQGQIMRSIPRIERYDSTVEFSLENASRLRAAGANRLSDLIETLIRTGRRDEGESYGVMLLTPADSEETTTLSAPIRNDTTASTGRGWAWTMSQRYTQLSRLTSGVTATSQL